MAKECMAAILLNENTLEDGTIRNEREYSDAAATAFLGKLTCPQNCQGLTYPSGASDIIRGVYLSGALCLSVRLLFRLSQSATTIMTSRFMREEEIDRVVGYDCLPTFDDEDKVPYVRAMCSELLRCV